MSVKIDRLILTNFKSYAGSTVIGPFSSFSCIVGPNGSGKSNIMDALSFVLGSSTASLRGQKLTDLIHRDGSDQDGAVSMVVRTADNSEVTLQKSVSRRGAVSFSVSGHAVSEKEFTTVLRKMKIGPRLGTFLVFQHEVEAVAQKKSKELTELLEHLSGSADLRDEYHKRRKALEEANEALSSASMDKRGAIAEVNQLRLHKKEAERFHDTTQQLTVQRRNLALYELFHMESQIHRGVHEWERRTQEISDMEKRIAEEENAKHIKKSYADKQKLHLQLIRAGRHAALDVRAKTETLDRIQATISHHERSLQQLKADHTNLSEASAAKSKESKRIQEHLAHQQTLLQQFEVQCEQEDAQTSALSGLGAPLQRELKELRKEADCKTITSRQQLATLRRQKESIEEGLKQCRSSIDSSEASKKDVLASIQRTEAHLAELHRKLEAAQHTHADTDKSLEEAVTTMSRAQEVSKSKAEELKRITDQLHDLRFLKDDTKHARQMVECIQSLKSLVGGVRGKLVDLCDVPDSKYRSAATVAMGKNLEALVVDTTETALACVRYLKEQRLPPMTFIPLSAIGGGGAVTDRLRSFGGTCRPLADVIRHEASVEPAIRYALGHTLVCDSLDEARAVALEQADGTRYKVVTLDGSMILKNGSIQGGHASVQGRARKWDEKHYDDLKAAREKLMQSHAGSAISADETRLEVEIRDLRSRAEYGLERVTSCQRDIASCNTKLRTMKQTIHRFDDEVAELRRREAHYATSIDKCASDMLKLQKDVHVVEARIFEPFEKKSGIPNVAQLEARQLKLVSERAGKRQHLTLLINKLKSSLESEARRGSLRSADDVRTSIEKLEKELAQAHKDRGACKGHIDEAQKTLDAAQQQLSKSKVTIAQLEAEMKQRTKVSDGEIKKLVQLRKQVSVLQAASGSLRRERLALFQQSRIELIDLPTTPASSVGAKRQRHAQSDDHEGPHFQISEPMPVEDMGNRRSTKEQLCVDFSEISERIRIQAADSATFGGLKQQLMTLIDQLEREQQSIAPNLKALNKFSSSEKRLGASSTHLDESRERARKAIVDFNHIKEQRIERFMTTFDQIQGNVDNVYRELTLGTRAQGVHGSAYLALEDAEEPYNGGTRYHATPPMKRFMTMDLLSGGERTMAALALLFAVHAACPTPFFVLDEVDAALDVGNVRKLAGYLSSHCGPTQYIVVSLKEELYQHADGLVGVFKDTKRSSSGIVTLDLRSYGA